MSIPQQQLEAYLWGAAVLLRGTIDAGDYKQFIFPLLFYKRLCDVFDEETQAALAASGGDADYAAYPENHRFQIPQAAHWRQVRQAASNVGQALQNALRAIETANPEKLYGIFGDAQWTNKDRLPDAMLRDLVEHFSTLELTLANLPEDELGQGYEYLIKKFADDSGHTAAEFYTNRTVVHLMTEMLQPQPGESIYDPTCGSGGMLLSAIAHLRRQGKEWRNVRLYGQERNLMTSSIARMNCFLHGIEDFRIERGDTLAEPKLVQGDRLMQFDVVLANPPYSIKQWDRTAFTKDPWGRNTLGTPPQGRADYAFWQHILSSLSLPSPSGRGAGGEGFSGRCAILFPHGVLFRKEEAEMRRKLVEADWVECVLGLGPNLFYNSPMEACVVICRRAKPKARRGKVLFINAVGEVTRERAQSFLTDEHIQRIVQAYERFSDEPGFTYVASLEEIRAKDSSLNIPLYVAASASPQAAQASPLANPADSLPQALEAWLASRKTVAESLSTLLPGLSLPKLDETLRGVADSGLFDRKGWRRLPFGAFAQNITTRAEPAEAADEIYVGLEHLDPQSLHLRRWGKGSDVIGTKFRFSKGDIIFGRRRAYQRKLVVAEFGGICSAHAMVIRAKSDVVLPEFLPFLMMSDKFMTRAMEISVGSLSPTISWATLKDEEYELPPIEQQRRIAEVLWGVDEAVQESEALCDAIDHSLNATAVDTVFPFGYSPASHKLDSRYKKAYRILKSSDLYEIFSGNGEPSTSEDGEVLYLKVNDFNLNTEEVSLEKGATWFDPKGNKKIRVLPIGTVIFPKRGASIFLNKVGIAQRLIALDPNLMGLIPRDDVIRSEYLYWLIKLTQIGRVADTTSLPQLNHKHIINLMFPVPPLDIQDAFLYQAQEFRVSQTTCRVQVDALRELQKVLINTAIAS